MEIFLTQTHHFRMPLLTPQSRVEHFLWWMDAHFWDSKSRPLITAIVKLGRARTFFYITPIVFVWKKKVIYTKDGLRVSKSWGNFHFWVLLSWTCTWRTMVPVSILQHIYDSPHDSSHPETESWCSQSCHLPKRGTLKEKKCLKLIHTDTNPIPSSALHTQTTVWCLINNSLPDLHGTKVENEQQKGTGKSRMTYFEAMCPGSHTVRPGSWRMKMGMSPSGLPLPPAILTPKASVGPWKKRDMGAKKVNIEHIAKPILRCSDVNGLTRVISTVRTPGSVPGGI